MKIYNLLGLIISVILGFITFFATSNVYVGGGVLVACILFYFLFVYKSMRKYIEKTNKIHECYIFTNNFLVTLSIKESLNASFDATKTSISDDFSAYMESIRDLDPQEKLDYLRRYFPFHIFSLFVDIINLWVDEGGKILEMSSHITNELRELEEYLVYSRSINKRKSFEIGVLWAFSLVIVVVLKFVLSDYYAGMLKQPIFIASICLFVFVILFSVYLLVQRVTKIEVRGNIDGK